MASPAPVDPPARADPLVQPDPQDPKVHPERWARRAIADHQDRAVPRETWVLPANRDSRVPWEFPEHPVPWDRPDHPARSADVDHPEPRERPAPTAHPDLQVQLVNKEFPEYPALRVTPATLVCR